MFINFKDLFEVCEKNNFQKIITDTGNEIFKVSGISVLHHNNQYSNIKCISRHYVTKDVFRIKAKLLDIDNTYFELKTTDDHTCIRINENWDFEQVSASKLLKFDNILVHCNNLDKLAIIESVENLGKYNDYVYDLEVDDNTHVYYANDILVHNSQFIDISPLVNLHLKSNNIVDSNISSLNQEQLDKMINELDDFIDNDVNIYIRDLINKECHTLHGHNLHYSREYVASQAMFFKKKHYIVHLIKKDDKNVDVFKYSGVSCKKAEIPVDMKYFLKAIFEDTCTKNWKEADYRKYIDNVFDQFLTKSYEHISIYKSYNTEKAITGFMESEKRTGSHARAANIYNQLLDDLKISNKYEKINVGDQLRYCYINDTNPYGINVIGFKEYIPEEFKKIFTINYDVMFDKIFLTSLKGYNEIMHFNTYSPNNKSICDISEL